MLYHFFIDDEWKKRDHSPGWMREYSVALCVLEELVFYKGDDAKRIYR